MISKANTTYTHACGHTVTCQICRFCFFLFFLTTSTLRFECLPRREKQSAVSMAVVLLHHHTAAELLLLRSQTQLLHVGICAGGSAHAPRRRFGHDVEVALCSCRLGLLLLEAGVRVRVGLLADVQTSLEEVSSGGHGGERRGEAGRGGRGAAAGGRSLEGLLLPGAVL